MTAVLVTVLFAAFGGSTLGAIFTDQQWGDIQSTLNFLVLIYLGVVQRNTRQEAVSTAADAVAAAEAAPTRTVTELTNGRGGDFQVDLAEHLADAMERKRRERGMRTRSTDVN